MRVIRLLLALATIGFVIHWVSGQEIPPLPTDPEKIIWLALALLALAPALFFRAAKWMLIIKPVYPHITLKQCLKSYVGAMPISMLTPGRVGELARLLYLDPAPKGKVQGVFLVALDKIMDLGSLLCWCVLGSLLFFNSEIAVLISLGALAILSFPLWMKHSEPLAKIPLKLFKVDANKLSFLSDENYSVNRVIGITICGLGCFAMEWLQTWFLVQLWSSDPVSLMTVSQIMAFVTLANILQLTFAGLGVREGLAGFWLKQFAGLPPMVGAASAFLLFVIDQIIPSIIGLKLKTRREHLESVD